MNGTVRRYPLDRQRRCGVKLRFVPRGSPVCFEHRRLFGDGVFSGPALFLTYAYAFSDLVGLAEETRTPPELVRIFPLVSFLYEVGPLALCSLSSPRLPRAFCLVIYSSRPRTPIIGGRVYSWHPLNEPVETQQGFAHASI
jgi:hypothetical protein